MEEINLIIAKNLKAFRERKKMSLEKVAELTGVSKTMIGQIERGESSPTIKTIWKIAKVLKISFTSLIHQPRPDAEMVLKSDVQVLAEDQGKYRVYPYFSFQDNRRFEVYTVEIEQDGFVSSDPHSEGTEEFIHVFEGEVIICVDEMEYQVSEGDALRFKADKPHSYRHVGETLTRFTMVIHYPA